MNFLEAETLVALHMFIVGAVNRPAQANASGPLVA